MMPTTSTFEVVLNRLRTPTARIGLVLSILNYAQATVGFFISFYLAKRLGPTGFGLYSYGIVIGTIVYSIVNFGAERTLVRDLVQLENKSQILTASLVLRAVLGFAVLILIALSFPLWVTGTPKRIIVMACCAGSVFWALFPTAWFDSEYRMHYHAIITFTEKLFLALLVLLLISHGGVSGAVRVAILFMLTRASSMLVQVVFVGQRTRFDFRMLRPNASWLLSINVMIVLAALASLFISHWNQIVLENRIDAEHLGYYALSFQMTAIVTLLQGQMLRIFFPKIATLTKRASDPSRAKNAMIRYSALISGISILIVLPLYLGAPLFIAQLFPQSYAASLDPLRILCLWAIFYGAARIINAFLINYRLESVFFWSSLVSGAVAATLGALLIPKYGGVGVALSLLISHPISVLIQAYYVLREMARRSKSNSILPPVASV